VAVIGGPNDGCHGHHVGALVHANSTQPRRCRCFSDIGMCFGACSGTVLAFFWVLSWHWLGPVLARSAVTDRWRLYRPAVLLSALTLLLAANALATGATSHVMGSTMGDAQSRIKDITEDKIRAVGLKDFEEACRAVRPSTSAAGSCLPTFLTTLCDRFFSTHVLLDNTYEPVPLSGIAPDKFEQSTPAFCAMLGSWRPVANTLPIATDVQIAGHNQGVRSVGAGPRYILTGINRHGIL
jgi:hypothetical protein